MGAKMTGSSFCRTRYLYPLLLCAAVFPLQVCAQYLQVSLLTPIDSGHAKPGQPVEAEAAFDWHAPTCMLHQGALLRGDVIDVQKASKKLEDSYVAFSIDQANCRGHRASPLSLQVVEIIGASPDNPARLLDVLPKGGGGLSAGQAPASTILLQPQGPMTVHPGEVLGMKKHYSAFGRRPGRKHPGDRERRKPAPWKVYGVSPDSRSSDARRAKTAKERPIVAVPLRLYFSSGAGV
jgi:hypothetical protein